jgi:hypothetical protein
MISRVVVGFRRVPEAELQVITMIYAGNSTNLYRSRLRHVAYRCTCKQVPQWTL